MLKILFCLLLLNQISFAEEIPSQDKFLETKLKNKSAAEDNINVVPFYSVKDLKKKGVETVKSEEATVESMLQDRVSKYKSVQDSLKYFSDLYKANKITNEKALLEFKWALRVLAKRKDAIVRITKNLKDQSKIEAITAAIETSSLENEASTIVQELDQKVVQPLSPRNIAASNKKEIKTVDQIKAEQQKAWNFYKNKTYLSAKKNKKENAEVAEVKPMEPAPIEKQLIQENKALAEDKKIAEETISVAQTKVLKDSVVEPVKEMSNETEIPSLIEVKEVSVDKSWKEIIAETDLNNTSKEEAKAEISVVTPEILAPIELIPENDEKKPKVEIPQIQTLVEKTVENENSKKDIQATLDLIKLKEQEALQNEYKYQNLLQKYNEILKENENKAALNVKAIDPETEQKKVIIEVKEQPKQLIILDETDGVQAIDEKEEPLKKSVKINSIQEQFQDEMSKDQETQGESNQSGDEVHYYKGNGLEEDGYLEESDVPQY